MQQHAAMKRKVLVYIPTYNCRDTIVRVIQDIPPAIRAIAEVLILDNCSADQTAEAVKDAMERGSLGDHVTVIQPPRNLGYSGSQKLAYAIALANHPPVDWVMMLHGDGQYPPDMLTDFLPHLSGSCGIVYGYRDKGAFGSSEETPLFTFLLIRSLSLLESLVTGYSRKEWHSGFAMHAVRFLQQVDLAALTRSPHIDGQLLFTAGRMDVPVQAIPIRKRYREYKRFGGWPAIKYVFTVLGLMVKFRLSNNPGRLTGPQMVPLEYRIVASRQAQ
jgi:glycosyltransferase involved in cell wall biosynthesis